MTEPVNYFERLQKRDADRMRREAEAASAIARRLKEVQVVRTGSGCGLVVRHANRTYYLPVQEARD